MIAAHGPDLLLVSLLFPNQFSDVRSLNLQELLRVLDARFGGTLIMQARLAGPAERQVEGVRVQRREVDGTPDSAGATERDRLPICASVDHFTLHAATRAGGLDVRAHEALIKYVLRPPLAQERVTAGPDGLVRIALKRPFADGTVAIDLDPLSLLAQLAASVPAQGTHTVRYAGVLASASKLRAIGPGPSFSPRWASMLSRARSAPAACASCASCERRTIFGRASPLWARLPLRPPALQPGGRPIGRAACFASARTRTRRSAHDRREGRFRVSRPRSAYRPKRRPFTPDFEVHGALKVLESPPERFPPRP